MLKSYKNNWKFRIMVNWGLAGIPLILGQIAVVYAHDLYLRLAIIFITAVIGISFAIRFLKIIDFYVLGGLRYVANQLNRVAEEADISATFSAKSQDEVGNMVTTLGKVFEMFREIISSSQQSSKQTTFASSEVARNAQQVQATTEQVANAIGQVSKGASEQSQSAMHINKSMEEMSASIQKIAKGAYNQTSEIENTASFIDILSEQVKEVANTSETVSSEAEESASAAKEGHKIVNLTVNGMAQIRETVLASADKMENLGKSSQQIGEIIGVIEDIADQTNLLALNAAIEAARAGEQGKGFAVVADEVRKLAERSAKATQEIASLIKDIQGETNEAVGAMKDGTEKVQEGMDLAEKAGQALEQIHSSITGVTEKIKKVAVSAHDMSEKSFEVVQSVDNISEIAANNTTETERLASQNTEIMNEIANITAIAQETAASSQQVAASAEEQSATVEELTASAQTLASLSEQLNSLVGRFKVTKEEKEKQPVKLESRMQKPAGQADKDKKAEEVKVIQLTKK